MSSRHDDTTHVRLDKEGEDSEEEDDLLGIESSGSVRSRSSASSDEKQARGSSISTKKKKQSRRSDESSSALSLPQSFDEATPTTTPIASPAPNRFRSFDAELTNQARPPQFLKLNVNTASSAPKVNDAMRKIYELQVDKIRRQLATVLDEKTQLQQALNTERRQYQNSISTLQSRYQNELLQLRNDKSNLEGRVKSLEWRLSAEKSQFMELRVSDALAQEFQRQDKDSLTLVEFIQMRVYELVQPHVAAAEIATAELENMKRLTKDATAVNNELKRSADDARRQEELANKNLRDVEQSNRQLHQQISLLQEALQKQTQSQFTHHEYKQWEHKYNEVDLELKRAMRSNEEFKVEIEQLQQKLQLLTVDKNYLMQEKEATMEKFMTISRQLDEAQANNRKLELSRETFLEQIAQAREESKTLFEHRMEVELNKLQDAAKKEMDIIRDGGKQMYERENRMLREARMDCLAQIDTLQKKVTEFQRAYDDKVLEFTRMDARWTTDLAEARNEIKMKHFELTQLGRSYEDKVNELHQSHLENEMLKQKVEVHKTEFSKLETSSSKTIAELEIAITAEREKLKSYEQLEVDMDNAILKSGSLSDEASITFSMIPTAPKRRFQQSVALAQKVVQYEQQLRQFEQQSTQLTNEKSQLSTELKAAQSQLTHITQPQQYLIEKLKLKEQQLEAAEAKYNQLHETFLRLQKEAQDHVHGKMALQSQLQHLLSRRQELETLKNIVLKNQSEFASIKLEKETLEPKPQETISTPKWYLKLRQPQQKEVSFFVSNNPMNNEGERGCMCKLQPEAINLLSEYDCSDAKSITVGMIQAQGVMGLHIEAWHLFIDERGRRMPENFDEQGCSSFGDKYFIQQNPKLS